MDALDAERATVGTAQAKAAAAVAAAKSPVAALLQFASGELAEALDAEKGDVVTDHAIFNAHARRYEKEYLEDMTSLGVKDPDVMTRVTEYVPKIIDFVEKIVEKGLAYRGASGSVYLDIDAFKARGTTTASSVPFERRHDRGRHGRGRGCTCGGRAREEEPERLRALEELQAGRASWHSPWGAGRPGWHIECSVVAGDILGAQHGHPRRRLRPQVPAPRQRARAVRGLLRPPPVGQLLLPRRPPAHQGL